MVDFSVCARTYLHHSQYSILYSHIECRRSLMVNEEKLKKACDNFSLLSEDQQDYILGILQALVFAKNANNQSKSEAAKKTKSAS
jgi:hypothetical protein